MVPKCTLCSLLPLSSATRVFRIKLSFSDLVWTKWNSFQHIDINCGFNINFCVRDIQLLFNHKIPKFGSASSHLYFFNFESYLPFFKRFKLNLSTHPPPLPLPLPPSPPSFILPAVIKPCKNHKKMFQKRFPSLPEYKRYYLLGTVCEFASYFN